MSLPGNFVVENVTRPTNIYLMSLFFFKKNKKSFALQLHHRAFYDLRSEGPQAYGALPHGTILTIPSETDRSPNSGGTASSSPCGVTRAFNGQPLPKAASPSPFTIMVFRFFVCFPLAPAGR